MIIDEELSAKFQYKLNLHDMLCHHEHAILTALKEHYEKYPDEKSERIWNDYSELFGKYRGFCG